MNNTENQHECHLCREKSLVWVTDIVKKPEVEVDYGIPNEKYFRQIFHCSNCGSYNNVHNLLSGEDFYEGAYNQAIDANAFESRFNRIIAIPEGQSDNKERVQRISDFLGKSHQELNSLSALDVGSGTCVFLYELRKLTAMQINCIDPDPIAIKHAEDIVKVSSSHTGNLFDFGSNDKYDLISFNKVLEHVEDPIGNIKRAAEFLKKDGVIYIEMPESDRIVDENRIDQRAEFAVEHLTVYNKKSMQYLASATGLKLLEINIITDPSGKYTIYGFYTFAH